MSDTNIAYVDVNRSTVTLKIEEVEPIHSYYSDLCGDLVVKVDREDIAGVVSPDCANFTLIGETIPDENGDVMAFTWRYH